MIDLEPCSCGNKEIYAFLSTDKRLPYKCGCLNCRTFAEGNSLEEVMAKWNALRGANYYD